jgi:UDP-N-acetylmuramate--alanine ligase
VVAVVTNIDREHLDHYGSYEALESAFVAFANRVPFWGLSVLCLDHPGVQAIVPRMIRRTTTYGFASQADLVATNPRLDSPGTRFDVRSRTERLGEVHLRLPGRHNVLNALATLAVARELDVPFAVAAEALSEFLGIERRFETKGVAAGVRVIDDYGHHPAEIRATLAAAREIHPGRIVVAFQPHRYTRTRDLWNEFVTAFNDADVLVLTDVYAAGETKIPGIEAALLADAIRAHGHRDVRFAANLDDALAALAAAARAEDLVVTLGAGSISQLGARLLEELGAHR